MITMSLNKAFPSLMNSFTSSFLYFFHADLIKKIFSGMAVSVSHRIYSVHFPFFCSAVRLDFSYTLDISVSAQALNQTLPKR